MKLTLNLAEMLDLWRLHYAGSPPLADAVFRRNDGIDSSAVYIAAINRWYARLLREAPASMLAPRRLDLPLPPPSAGASTVLSLPAGTVRVLEVRLASWLRPAEVITDPSSPQLPLQFHRFTRATAASPVAFFSGGELRLYPAATADDRLLSLDCAVCEDGLYEFDDSALACLHNYTCES